MGKKITSKVVTVSDANLEKIKYVVEQLPKKSAKKEVPVVKKADDRKTEENGGEGSKDEASQKTRKGRGAEH